MHQAEEEDTLGIEMVRMEIKPEVERARIAVVRVVLEPPVGIHDQRMVDSYKLSHFRTN